MSAIWTPPRVSRELRRETAREKAQLLRRAHQRQVCMEFDADLKKIDPRLQMVWFDEDVDLMGVVPGRYHLLRIEETGSPPTIIPICDERGGFIEPNSGLFEWLRRQDMWNDRANQDRKRAREEAQRALERARERENEERQQELEERWRAVSETSVSMNRSAPWTQTVHGRGGARR